MLTRTVALLLFGCTQLWGGGAVASPFAYIPNFGSGNVSVIDTATDTVVATVAVGVGPFGIAVSADATRAYVTNSGSSSVSVIDAASNTVAATVPVSASPYGIAVNRAGTRIFVTSIAVNAMFVIDASTLDLVATIPMATHTWGIAIDPTDQLAYVGVYGDGTTSAVAVVSVATNAVVAMIPVPACALGVAANPVDSRVYATNSCGNQVWVVDTLTNSYQTAVAVPPFPFGVAVDPAGTRVYATSQSGSVTVFDAVTNAITAFISVNGGLGQPRGVMLNATGTRAYVANQNRDEVVVIDTATNAIVRTILVGASPIAFGQSMAPPPRSMPAREIPAIAGPMLWALSACVFLAGMGYIRTSRRIRQVQLRH